MQVKKRGSLSAFTLIEVLVVMIIILIVTTIAVLAIGDAGRSQRAEYFAQNIMSLLSYAENYAILKPSTLKFEIQNTQYRFSEFTYTQDKNTLKLISAWKNPTDNLLQPQTLPNYVNAHLSNPILIGANGNLTPFTLTLSVPRETERYIITGNAAGNIAFAKKGSSS